MSKMTKLLQKAQEQRDIENHNLKDSIESETSNDTMALNKQWVSNLSFSLTILVLCVAVASLFVSFKAVSEMKTGRMATLNLLDQIEKQSKTIEKLDGSLLSVKSVENSNWAKLNEQVEIMSDALVKNQLDFKKKQMEVSRLVKEYSDLVESTEEIRATNRVLLEKFVNINQEIAEIKDSRTFTTAQAFKVGN